ncbi:MAG TPA: glycosyltransferase [bacterium]|nr:glycosyltransferase [bacterium]
MPVPTHTVILVHLSGQWQTFHRRPMLLALARALPDGVALLVVDRPITLDVGWWRHPRRFVRHVWRSGLRDEDGKLHVIQTRIPFHDHILYRLPGLSSLNAWLLGRQLRHHLRRLGLAGARVIHWIYHPVQLWVTRSLAGRALVYECYDEYAHTPDGEFLPWMWECDLRTLAAADLSLVTTAALCERRAPHARSIHVVPNGIPDSFLNEPADVPDPADRIPHPRIGYVGVFRRPIDTELLCEVFRDNPEWHLVMIGPVTSGADAARLRRLPNAHFLGARPFDALPAILRKLDVGLIPHRVTAFTEGMRPLKLAEYLSAGLPVAATPLPELTALPDLVAIGENEPSSFTAAIVLALSRRTPEFRRRAQQWAQLHTWDHIVADRVMPPLRRLWENAD